MTHEITASWGTLMQQSKDTAQDYFASANRMLEGSGLEFTASDVVALAKVMADDFHTASMGVATQKICEALGGVECGLDGIGVAVSELTL
jgi:hypothetical protein